MRNNAFDQNATSRFPQKVTSNQDSARFTSSQISQPRGVDFTQWQAKSNLLYSPEFVLSLKDKDVPRRVANGWTSKIQQTDFRGPGRSGHPEGRVGSPPEGYVQTGSFDRGVQGARRVLSGGGFGHRGGRGSFGDRGGGPGGALSPVESSSHVGSWPGDHGSNFPPLGGGNFPALGQQAQAQSQMQQRVNGGGRDGNGRDGGGRGSFNTQNAGRAVSGTGSQKGSMGQTRGGSGTPSAPMPSPLAGGAGIGGQSRESTFEEAAATLKKFTAVLNKITPEKYNALLGELKELRVDPTDPLLMGQIITLIFEKALSEANFSATYATLCHDIQCHVYHRADVENAFKKSLLSKCQTEFEKGLQPIGSAPPHEVDPVIWAFKCKSRTLGNIKFIGELFKHSMIAEKVMHKVVKVLLFGEPPVADPSPVATNEEELEALCKLLEVSGKGLDRPEARNYMNHYFKRIDQLAQEPQNGKRIRFLLLRVFDLRRNNWVPRRDDAIDAPQTLAELNLAQEREKLRAKGIKPKVPQAAPQRVFGRSGVALGSASGGVTATGGTGVMSLLGSLPSASLDSPGQGVRKTAQPGGPRQGQRDGCSPTSPAQLATISEWDEEKIAAVAKRLLSEYLTLSSTDTQAREVMQTLRNDLGPANHQNFIVAAVQWVVSTPKLVAERDSLASILASVTEMSSAAIATSPTTTNGFCSVWSWGVLRSGLTAAIVCLAEFETWLDTPTVWASLAALLFRLATPIEGQLAAVVPASAILDLFPPAPDAPPNSAEAGNGAETVHLDRAHIAQFAIEFYALAAASSSADYVLSGLLETMVLPHAQDACHELDSLLDSLASRGLLSVDPACAIFHALKSLRISIIDGQHAEMPLEVLSIIQNSAAGIQPISTAVFLQASLIGATFVQEDGSLPAAASASIKSVLTEQLCTLLKTALNSINATAVDRPAVHAQQESVVLHTLLHCWLRTGSNSPLLLLVLQALFELNVVGEPSLLTWRENNHAVQTCPEVNAWLSWLHDQAAHEHAANV